MFCCRSSSFVVVRRRSSSFVVVRRRSSSFVVVRRRSSSSVVVRRRSSSFVVIIVGNVIADFGVEGQASVVTGIVTASSFCRCRRRRWLWMSACLL